MIQLLLSWAVDNWHVLEAHVALQTLGHVGGPVSVLGLSPLTFIALLEGVVRTDPGSDPARLDAVYQDAKAAATAPDPAAHRSERRRDIARAVRLFG